MRTLLLVTILFCISWQAVRSQPLRNRDYIVNLVSLGSRIVSVYKHFGQPHSVTKLYNHYTDPDSDIVCNYNTLTVYLDHQSIVKSFEIRSTSYCTLRGVGIGASRQDVFKWYGKPNESDSSYTMYREQK